MKKFLCALLACAMGVSAAVGLAGCGCSDEKALEPGYVIEETEPDLQDGEFGFFITNSNELMLTKYTGTATDVEIPAVYNNYEVTAIGNSVFSRSDITSVVMPDTIKTIYDYAFFACHNLKSVTFSKNLENLGTNVFNMCSSLESVELPSSIKNLGVYTFSATGLKSITIPENKELTKINAYVLYQCKNLTEITIPATVTELDEFAICENPNKVTIKAPKGSAAEKYAIENNLGYEELK